MAPRKGRAPAIRKPKAPDTFVEVPAGFDSVPTEERVPEPIASAVADYVAWLHATKKKKRQLTGERDVKLRRKNNLPPFEALLAKYPIDQPVETPAPDRRPPRETPLQRTGPATRGMIGASEIKPEPESPAALHAQPAKTPVLKSVVRLKEEFAESPRKNATRANSAQRAAAPTKATEDAARKYDQVLQRKEQQNAMRAEKVRKEREEKNRRAEEKRKQQEEEDKRKREEAQRKEAAAELRRQQHMSPARNRIGSAMNTPGRMAPKTPNNTVRTRLVFDDTPSRTPGRVPAKAAKLEHPAIGTAAAVNTNFGSVPREVKRKAVRAAGATTQEHGEAPAQRRHHHHAAGYDEAELRANQMRLLMAAEEDEQRQRQMAEEQRQQKEEEQRRQREEEERLEKERRREERRRIREAEERRKQQQQLEWEEAERRAAAEAAEEQRLRQEEMARLQREQDEREEEELAQKLNESMLEDQDEPMEEEDGQEQQPADASTYDMTMDKVFLPSTADNYNIEDLDSGDETDDETAPRKKVPSWAEWPALTRLGIEQTKMSRDFDIMYGTMESPHTQPIFKPSKKPRRARGSSAQWNSPASNPTKGKSRFLGV